MSAEAAGEPQERRAEPPPPQLDTRYSSYVLGVLVLVYVFNFIDRQILSILNEEIKRDLGLSDAQMGFLYGTAFAVFYALFGIPLGRLADVWTRRSLISVSLAFWSTMTALSGLARNFAQLGAARIGVGVGEAGATPAAFSLLSDSFPPAKRATVLALYSSGIYIGAGAGLFIGGAVVERWNATFANGAAPFGLAGWQVAFFVVGLPGLFLALWVRSLREPVRGAADGIYSAPEPHPFREFGRELLAVIPPLTLLSLIRLGGGRGALAINLFAAAAWGATAWLLVATTGNPAQWIALGIGLYATTSWIQSLVLRDRPAAALILHTPTLLWAVLGLSMLAFAGYGFGYWTAPFFVRFHEMPLDRLGLILGGIVAVFGFLGITLGGIWADAWRRRNPRGRLYVGMIASAVPLPVLPVMLLTESTSLALAMNAVGSLVGAMWIGVGASTIQDLVLPRMRATASAAYLLAVTFIGLALGPYIVGRVSDFSGDLRWGLASTLLANVLAVLFLAVSARFLARDEATLRDRARAAGEMGL